MSDILFTGWQELHGSMLVHMRKAYTSDGALRRNVGRAMLAFFLEPSGTNVFAPDALSKAESLCTDMLVRLCDVNTRVVNSSNHTSARRHKFGKVPYTYPPVETVQIIKWLNCIHYNTAWSKLTRKEKRLREDLDNLILALCYHHVTTSREYDNLNWDGY